MRDGSCKVLGTSVFYKCSYKDGNEDEDFIAFTL